ncbi:SHOCT domain-containing protein [Microbacterium paraoxydans]|uniref:SHOCT domain-containing protein n=1 Tax=Microbacterium paraoxydans TaxID=199592 RepID=UPI00352EAD07
MFGRRAGRGGLIRAAAATTVVTGTATAVTGGVRARQDSRVPQDVLDEAYAQQRQQAQIDMTAQQAVSAQRQRWGSPPPEPVSASRAGSELVAQIQALADLHERGLLSEDEFIAGKARLLI